MMVGTSFFNIAEQQARKNSRDGRLSQQHERYKIIESSRRKGGTEMGFKQENWYIPILRLLLALQILTFLHCLFLLVLDYSYR